MDFITLFHLKSSEFSPWATQLQGDKKGDKFPPHFFDEKHLEIEEKVGGADIKLRFQVSEPFKVKFSFFFRLHYNIYISVNYDGLDQMIMPCTYTKLKLFLYRIYWFYHLLAEIKKSQKFCRKTVKNAEKNSIYFLLSSAETSLQSLLAHKNFQKQVQCWLRDDPKFRYLA